MTKVATATFLIGVSLAAAVSAQGSTAWVQRYNGLSDDVDVATAVAVDTAGSAYVTGHSCTATDPNMGVYLP
jgi:hypothetical protein